MKQFKISRVGTLDPNTAREIQKAHKRSVNQERSITAPGIALANNFDPDQKGFVTAPMKGFRMLQFGANEGTVGRLAVHADYGVTPIGSLDQIRVQPGKPQLIYPVAAHGPNMSTTFIRGGKETPYRHYEDTALTNVYTSLGSGLMNFMIVNQNTAVNFIGIDLIQNWNANSALPPGWRYLEVNDWRAWGTGGHDLIAGHLISEADLVVGVNAGLSLAGLAISSAEELLPHDPEGHIRRNIKPLTGDEFSSSATILADDIYWSGTARDPVAWFDVDEFWQENRYNGLTPETIQTYLDTHQGAKLY